MTNDITFLRIERLQPNPWNPNQMTEAEFVELVDEVRRLGRVPKPIVVRPLGDLFEIVDGEHNWQAAQDIGFTELPCEIIDADDFEAMRQTYKRNQHGQHCRVREGRMFRTMRDQGNITYTELAVAAGISEGTVRNRLQYARAAAIRNCYAGENRDAEIDALKVRQVRAYVDLPSPLGDMWLDAGGTMGFFGNHKDYELRHIGLQICRFELVQYLDRENFRDSFGRLADLAIWLEQHDDLDNAIDYILSIAEMRLPSLLAWIIPIQRRDSQRQICMTLDDWLEILTDAQMSNEIPAYLTVEAARYVYEHLESSGIDPHQMFDGFVIAHIEELMEMPDYIRDASPLMLEERFQLHHAHAPASQDVIEQAKRETIEYLRRERSLPSVDCPNTNEGAAYVLAVFLAKARAEYQADGQVITCRVFDRDEILQSLDEISRWCPFLSDTTLNGRPAIMLFRERMSELRTAELVVIRTLLSGSLPTVAIGNWMDAIHFEEAC